MNSKKKPEPKGPKGRVLAVNRKARFDFEILETYEAGMMLTGAEIKSIRLGNINLAESYIRPKDGELFLIGAHISPYTHAGLVKEYEPTRARKLLLHKNDIIKLRAKVEQKGLTIVALDVHLTRGYAKLQMGLARGKAAPDKRKTTQEREQKRDVARIIKYGG
jgi:SsrA-binding protein